jgi:hypothetical protein
VLGVGLLVASACAHPRLAPAGFNVSSERSDYSPTLRLAVALPIVPTGKMYDTITVVIDSAIVSAPGVTSTDTTPVMRNLYITPLLATRGLGDESATGIRPPWRALAAGDSAPLAGALRLGERVALGRIQLHIVPPSAFDPARSWIVFRITGDAVTKPVKLADGTMMGRRSVSPVRVFACADWTLGGYVDRGRAKALARAYTAAC